MKELKKVFLIYLLFSFILALLVNVLVDSLLGIPPGWLEMILESVFYALLAGGFMSLIGYSFLKLRLKFLLSDDPSVPVFAWQQVRVIPIEEPNFSFEVIKYRIREHFVITQYDDVSQHLLKFRTRFGLRSWGVGGCVVYDEVARSITLTCFSMSAFSERETRSAQAVIDKVEGLIRGK